jgi:hypothetical protein
MSVLGRETFELADGSLIQGGAGAFRHRVDRRLFYLVIPATLVGPASAYPVQMSIFL